jgi:hypothetical protein
LIGRLADVKKGKNNIKLYAFLRAGFIFVQKGKIE